jgi:hypothetical protein
MIALFAALSLTLAAPPEARPKLVIVPQNGFSKVEPACSVNVLRTAEGKAATVHRLGQLPDANLEIAVARIDQKGCQKPLIVAYRVSR